MRLITRRESLTTGLSILIGSAIAVAQDPAGDRKVDVNEPVEKKPGPSPLPEVPLGPTLPTHPVRRGTAGPNWTMAEAVAMPRDRPGIWVLEFAFKPVRMIDVDIPGKGRKRIHYMAYRVVNRTGKPQMFVPQFSLITDTGKRYEDVPFPQAVDNIQAKEEPTKAKGSVLGAVTVCGYIPPSLKEGIDDAVYGVAVWDAVDYEADAFKVFVRGLSDGNIAVQPPEGKPYTRYKSLRIDFLRPGDRFKPFEKEIHLGDPPYEWTYYP